MLEFVSERTKCPFLLQGSYQSQPDAPRHDADARTEGAARYPAWMASSARSVVGTVLLLVSLGLLAAGWRLTETDRFFLLHAAKADGIVAAHEPYDREARKPEERFRIVVAFSTASGDRIRFRTVASYGRPPYAVGATVPVRYDASQPTRARIDRRIEFLAPVLIWLGAVVVLALLGLGIAVYGPKTGFAR